MGASFYWKPSKCGKSLPVNASNSFRSTLEEAFGSPPWKFSHESKPILIGIRAADKNEREAIDEIMEAIDTHDSIEVEVSY